MSAKQTTYSRRREKRHVRCPNCGKYMGGSKGGKTYSSTKTTTYTDGNKTVTKTRTITKKKTKVK